MNKLNIVDDTYAGMLYSSDFVYWYTYLKRRIDRGWSAEELSFLLGKAPFHYVDFERMHEVDKFLVSERLMLDRIYQDSTVHDMRFHRESYELNEERIVRVNIQEDRFYREYEIVIPWELKSKDMFKEGSVTKTRHYPIPELKFKEWLKEESLEMASDAGIYIREKFSQLLRSNFFKEGRLAIELFQAVEFTGRQQLKIQPMHVSDGLYNLIKAGVVYIRNLGGRYVFFKV